MKTIGILILLGLGLIPASGQAPNNPFDGKVEEYWSGGAEISRYKLSQARYGEQREGDAVLIFVREPFLPDEQVKDESGGRGVPTLKLNSTRKFLTGIYPYSTMVSIFQPLDQRAMGRALKVTTSVQEWCGHVFTQTNRKPAALRTVVHSYFEKEDGKVYRADSKSFLEDELWTTLRLAPESVPIGNYGMIPGSLFCRLAHVEPVETNVIASWQNGPTKETSIYRVEYPNLQRVLEIVVAKEMPYTIEGWRETRGSEVTEAKLTHRLTNQNYWSQNGEKDRALRAKLGLDKRR